MPQLENGYLKIANELVEALSRVRIAGEANQILWTIIRKTYGFNKKEDAISLSQFTLATGLKKQHVSRAIAKLRDINIIIKKDDGPICKYSINKDYSSWTPLSKKVTTVKRKSSLLNCCYICKFTEALHKHHIKPTSEGGSNRVSNKIHLCPNCHALTHKGKYSQEYLVTKKDNVENATNKDNENTNNGDKVLPKKVNTKESIKDIIKESIYSVFKYWNEQGITKHKIIDKYKPSINAALKDYPEEEIKKAISNYNKILNDSAYYWTHKWTLKEFLQRGLDKFRDENKPFDNYKSDRKGGSRGENQGARRPEKGKYDHLDK
ncbi:replication protein [Candidatus Pacearchaeota archaeon]|nr:replication protein [Candidatus Pacearchaeota archaeon]